jgi:methylglutaconyl-CoA hydratase
MSTVLVEDAGGVRTITLNRPERRNALVPEMMDELAAAFHEAAAHGARVVVLRGEGESFCAGLDLAELAAMAHYTPKQHLEEAERVAKMFRAVWDCDLPTIAVVRRTAIAGGAGLAMLCDFTLAGPEALFGFTEARIGFVPALVSAYLSELIGDKATRGLLLSAMKFNADEAMRLGIVNEVLPQEQLQDRVKNVILELLHRAQHAESLDRALKLAMEANAASRDTADFREGVTAFVEKRKPVWKT